jgi:hypothetical protein
MWFAGIFRLSAYLFQAHFCFQGDHILTVLADIDFLSARIFQNSRSAPAEFPVTGERLFWAFEIVCDFT